MFHLNTCYDHFVGCYKIINNIVTWRSVRIAKYVINFLIFFYYLQTNIFVKDI